MRFSRFFTLSRFCIYSIIYPVGVLVQSKRNPRLPPGAIYLSDLLQILHVLLGILVEILDAVIAAEADRLALVSDGLSFGVNVFAADRAFLIRQGRLGRR